MDHTAKIAVVAEDEALVRMLAVDALETAGFTVIEAKHAQEALSILVLHAGTVSLLFTDVYMPGHMNGLALAHYVRATWPEVAVIIASGEARPPLHTLPAGSMFVEKPYDLDRVTLHARSLTGN